uniref:CCR4-NOT transcription complex subunit 10 n=1 Tax=Panagrellus redivivus TaxID=6233 RepID=A0A7E4V3Q9_PANRE
MVISLLNSCVRDPHFDYKSFDALLNKFPVLRKIGGDSKDSLSDREVVIAAFKCACYAYAYNLRAVARCLFKAILNSPDVQDEVVCATALFDAQIALDQNQTGYAAEVVRRLVALHQWTKANDELKNTFALISTKISLRQIQGYRFPDLNGRKLEDIEWLTLRITHGYKDGSFKNFVKPLFALRTTASLESQIAIDATIGDVFYYGFENCETAAEYYASALSNHQAVMNRGGPVEGFVFPLDKVYYELGSVFMCIDKPNVAFYNLLMGLPHAAGLPDSWMRIAQAAILVHISNPNALQETQRDVALAKQKYEAHYSHPQNYHRANDILREDFFRANYEPGLKPEPTLPFALICVQRACKIVEERPNGYAHLQIDLITMYVYLSLELGVPQKALDAIGSIGRMPNVTKSHRNVSATYKAKAYALMDKATDAVAALNSIVYPTEEERRRPLPKPHAFYEMAEAHAIESCYEQAFALFAPIDRMRVKFAIPITNTRKTVRDYLRTKNLTAELKHQSDVLLAPMTA